MLCDRAAETQHFCLDQPADLVEEEPRSLEAELFADGGRADDVGDEHRHDPALAGGVAHAGDSDSRWSHERCRATLAGMRRWLVAGLAAAAVLAAG